ncbi:MAG TPA: DNA polymerase Y family protein [Burkholderiales bacterium]|nr:DNA polymerase Y family protein [Burkholderiales bacterium]
MALWAGRFTPHIVLRDAGLLLEVEASLTLFGGLPALMHALKTDLSAMAYSAQIGIAPTARAAWWLALISPGRILQTAQLPLISKFPLHVLACSDKQLAFFESLGLHNIGDLLRLPRAAVAERCGQALLDSIDEALGKRAEAHVFFEAPAQFDVRVELPAEVTQVEALNFVLNRLLIQLCAFLGGRLAAIRGFEIRFEHRDIAATRLTIGLLRPSRDTGHLTLLARERLGHLRLTAPVRAFSLHARDLVQWGGENNSLLQDETTEAEEWPKLAEQLRARLGAENVQGLQLQADHRPEAASQMVEPNSLSAELRYPLRPLWLLPQPEPLREQGAGPYYKGALKLIAGPERIRSGWWDAKPASRDYFIAQTQDQALLWIYRENGRSWYLHGHFA